MTGNPQTPDRRPYGAAFVIAAFLIAVGGVLIWQASGIPDKGGYAGVNSADAPFFVGAGLVVLGLIHVVQGMRGTGQTAVPSQSVAPILFIIAGLGLQLVLLKPLGFTIASGLLFAFTAAAFGKRNFALTIPIGLVFAFLVYGVFDQVLKLNLPAGLPENLIFGG